MTNVSEWSGAEDEGEWAEFMSMPGMTMVFNVHRSGNMQPGHSFSPEALDAIMSGIKLWVGSRLMRQWVETGEPPVSMDITVTVENAVKATDEAHRKWRDK